MEGRKTTMSKTVSRNEKIILQAMMPKGFLRNQDVITLFLEESKTYCYELLNQMERKGFVRKRRNTSTITIINARPIILN